MCCVVGTVFIINVLYYVLYHLVGTVSVFTVNVLYHVLWIYCVLCVNAT